MCCEKPSDVRFSLVGVTGFDPATSSSRSLSESERRAAPTSRPSVSTVQISPRGTGSTPCGCHSRSHSRRRWSGRLLPVPLSTTLRFPSLSRDQDDPERWRPTPVDRHSVIAPCRCVRECATAWHGRSVVRAELHPIGRATSACPLMTFLRGHCCSCCVEGARGLSARGLRVIGEAAT